MAFEGFLQLAEVHCAFENAFFYGIGVEAELDVCDGFGGDEVEFVKEVLGFFVEGGV